MKNLPSQLIECTNIMMVILFFWMMMFALLYLWDKLTAYWRYSRSLRMAMAMVYYDCKPAIALSVMVWGIAGRTLVLAWTRHYESRGLPVPALLATLNPYIFGGSTGAAITGLICWIRVISPWTCSNWVWITMIGSAFSAAYVIAYLT